MSEFKIGDRVELNNDGHPTNDSGKGTITEVQGRLATVNFDVFKHGTLGLGNGTPLSAYPIRRLTLVEPSFVNVVTQKTVWVTLPGDNAGHKLTNDDALTLLRQLEEALS